MKKKLLLAVLPALLVLSACNPLSSYAAAGAKVNQFAEDTIAHEDIFGEAQEVEQFEKPVAFQRNPGEDITAPKIGYQIKYDSGENTLAIRFLAAVKDLNVKAYWRRGVAGPDGNPINSKVFSNTFEPVTKYYKSLTAGDETITAGEAPYADYEGFVVYTIYGIPYNATNKKAYVAAYVNLVGDENGQDDGVGGTYNKHSNSVGLAVSIERKTEAANEPDLKNVFTFDPTYTGYFLEGTINGTVFDGGANGLYRESDRSKKGDNLAWYEKVGLKTTDSFGSFYYEQDNSFEFYGNNEFFDTAVDHIKESSLAGYNAAKTYDGYYTLYVSSGTKNHVYPTLAGYQEPLYFYGGGASLWDGQTASKYKVYMWGDGGSDDEVLSETATKDGKTVYKITKFNSSKYQNIKIDRCNKDNMSEVWDSTGDQNNFYNYILTNGPYNYFKVTGWNNSVGWGSYAAEMA